MGRDLPTEIGQRSYEELSTVVSKKLIMADILLKIRNVRLVFMNVEHNFIKLV